MMGFNNKHPEMRTGEVFLTNLHEEDLNKVYPEIGWNTKRKGIQAFDIYGNPIAGYVPIFAMSSELERAGIDINKLKYGK